MNMQALMKQAQTMQKEITNAQNEINSMEFDGKNGLVSVKMTGDKKLLEVDIVNDEELKEDLTILEDMIVLAVNDALSKIDEKTKEKLGKYTSMMPGLF